MREVSCRVTALVVDSIDRQGVDWTACLDGLGLTREALVDPRQRIDWETCVVLLDRLERAAGGPERFEASFVPRGGERTGHPFVQLARTFLGAADVYRLVARWGITRDVSVAHGVFEELGARRARLTITLDQDRTGSLPFFRFFVGMLRSFPGLVGLPPARVTYRATPHEGVYELELPPPLTAMKRLRRAMSVIAGASATIEALESQAQEIRAKNDQLEARLAERHAVEARLREQQAWLALALEAGRVSIWSWDVPTNRARWSAGAFLEEDAPQPATFEAYLARVHPDDRQELEASVRRVLASTEMTYESEHRLVRSDGSMIWVHTKANVVRDSDGSALTMTGTLADVSERKRLETQLLFVDRMVSAGKLAAGVAHELNNPLSYVMTNVELMRRRLEGVALPESDALTLHKALDDIADGGERMRHIMNDLRTFARPEEQRHTDVDIARIMDASIRLVSNEIRHRAQLVIDYASDVPRVTANESRLGQVFINLLVNAAHAIPESPERRGIIRVSTRTNAEGCAVAVVQDDGVGIGPGALRRIFEPFFTTKQVGKGTGLGLAVSQNIVSSLGGRIEVESELGRGSTFRVILPASTEPSAPPPPGPSPEPAGGRILVIDDEPRLRASLKMLLDSHGFDVTTAASGSEGLALALGPAHFDVILCDLMMPGITGMDVHAELVQKRPELARRTVFLTGGAFTPRASDFLEEVRNPRLDKPFELAQLLAAIDRIAKQR